jgi:hypothetical protein
MLAALALAAPAQAAELGHVVAVEGRATAFRPGQAERVLVCGDPIHEDERLATAPGARLVIASDAHHAHLGPEAELVLGRAAEGALEIALARGTVRLLAADAKPLSLVATPAGWARLAGSDLELVRSASGALRVCDWTTGVAGCHEVDLAGGLHAVVEEGPRLDLGLGELCEWRPQEDGIRLADFSQPAPAGAETGGPQPFDPERDPGRPCDGDECRGFVPDLPAFDPTEDDRVLTVAQPPPALPF